MGRKTPPSDRVEGWTTARYWQFIRSALRSASSKYPPKNEAKKKNRRPVKSKGRQKWEYQCVECNKWFSDKETQVDHIIDAGSLKDYKDLPKFVDRLFCTIDGFQILCKKCHQEKTNQERKLRKLNG